MLFSDEDIIIKNGKIFKHIEEDTLFNTINITETPDFFEKRRLPAYQHAHQNVPIPAFEPI